MYCFPRNNKIVIELKNGKVHLDLQIFMSPKSKKNIENEAINNEIDNNSNEPLQIVL